MIHDLQQQVEYVGMGLLDLVEQQDAMRLFVDRLGEQATLVEAHVSGRGTDEARYRMALHVLRHIKTQQLDTEHVGELPGHLGLAHAGRPRKQESPDWFFRTAQPRTRLDKCHVQADFKLLGNHIASDFIR